MRISRIKAKLSKNQPVLLTTIHYSDPSIFEMASLMGFDGIWLDLEHHHHSVETANSLLRAARVGSSDVMVRPAKWEFMRMGRILEAGATGIMYPRCDNAAEAREVVRWSKFAPLGQRGIDAANPDNPYCLMPLVEYLKAANEQTFIVIQIEDPSALAQVDEIAAVDGVDIVFFGPGDFSILSGIPGQMNHELIKDAMQCFIEFPKPFWIIDLCRSWTIGPSSVHAQPIAKRDEKCFLSSQIERSVGDGDLSSDFGFVHLR